MAALEQRRSPAATSGEEPAPAPAAAPERPAPARWSVRVSAWVAAAAGALALWGAAAAAVGAPALPGGQLFALALLAAAAAAAGAGARRLRLPELVGPLAAGALLRSLGVVQLDPSYQHAAAVVRKAALAVILIRAGLGLDGAALRRLLALVLRLAVVPSAVEAATLAAVAHLLLGLPWLWGLMAGAMMAAVSPAVVIPALFRLQAKGYGTEKGIPTLVVAAASLDDVIAVTAFGIMYGIVFADEGSAWGGVVRGALALPMGLAFGAAWGALARFVPRSADANAAPLRTLLVAGGGLLAVLGSDAIGYDGAGPLGAILAAFVAAHAWRRRGTHEHGPVAEHFRAAWAVFQTLLFALIGAEVDVAAMQPLHVALGAAALAVALAARIAVTVLIAFGADLTWREKLFLSFAWFPKATVQAALGPAALDATRRLGLAEAEPHARHLLTLAALAILLTAPLGSALLSLLGPRLLHRAAPPAQNLNSIGNSNEGFDNVPEDSATGRFESQSNGQTPTSAGAEDTESANGRSSFARQESVCLAKEAAESDHQRGVEESEGAASHRRPGAAGDAARETQVSSSRL